MASQILIFSPGTDVSPYAFISARPQPLTYAGATIQVWAILFLFLACVKCLFFARQSAGYTGYRWIIVTAVAISFAGAVTSTSIPAFAEGVGKLTLPLLLFACFASSSRSHIDRELTNLVLVVNIFTVSQAFAARVFTGTFAANRYYLELPEEYFGYFYHPFAFAGILGACSIVVMNNIRQRRHRFLMFMLLGVNIFFILQSQVRTYIVATVVAVMVSIIGVTVARRSAKVTFLVAGVLSVAAVLVGNSLVARTRTTYDVSSGRLDRWIMDIDYVWSTASVGQLLFGGGPGYIAEVNFRLFGVSINSLNAIIDIFVDFGIVGMLLVLGTWVTVLRGHYLRTGNPMTLGVVALFGVSALVTSPVEFPAVAVMLVVVAWAVTSQSEADAVTDPGKPIRSRPHATGGSERSRKQLEQQMRR